MNAILLSQIFRYYHQVCCSTVSAAPSFTPNLFISSPFFDTLSFPSFSLPSLPDFPDFLHPPLSFPCLHLTPGCHSAHLLFGLPGHPTEGVGLHRLLHLYITPAGDTSTLTAARLRYTHLLASPGSWLQSFYFENKQNKNYNHIVACSSSVSFQNKMPVLLIQVMAGITHFKTWFPF